MRTTLDIDDDVLMAAKEMAAKEKTTAGRILSAVFRKALNTNDALGPKSSTQSGFVLENGVPVVPSRGEIITNAHIERLMEQEGV